MKCKFKKINNDKVIFENVAKRDLIRILTFY